MPNETIKRVDVINALEAAGITDIESAIREYYEGRGNVKAGFGIIVSHLSQAFAFFASLGVVGGENDEHHYSDDATEKILTSDDTYNLAHDAGIDAMGHETIVYFPGWELT